MGEVRTFGNIRGVSFGGTVAFFIKRGNDNGSALLRTLTITRNFGPRNKAGGCVFSARSARSRLYSTVEVSGNCHGRG